MTGKQLMLYSRSRTAEVVSSILSCEVTSFSARCFVNQRIGSGAQQMVQDFEVPAPKAGFAIGPWSVPPITDCIPGNGRDRHECVRRGGNASRETRKPRNRRSDDEP